MINGCWAKMLTLLEELVLVSWVVGLLARVDQFKSDELEAALLEARDDGADQTALNAVGLGGGRVVSYDMHSSTDSSYLDHDVGAFRVVRHRELESERDESSVFSSSS